MLIRERIKRFANPVYRSKHCLSAGGVIVPRRDNVLQIITPEYGKGAPRLHLARNIITDDGDQWYAESAAGETPTNTFDRLFLSTVAFSPAPSQTSDAGDLASTIAGSEQTETALYPRTNDPDGDNTGAAIDVVTHQFAYTAAAFNDPSIEGGTITATGTTFGSGTNPLLNAFNETAYAKSATDTLKVIVNHTFNGV